jgi:hypothetical protein
MCWMKQVRCRVPAAKRVREIIAHINLKICFSTTASLAYSIELEPDSDLRVPRHGAGLKSAERTGAIEAGSWSRHVVGWSCWPAH